MVNFERSTTARFGKNQEMNIFSEFYSFLWIVENTNFAKIPSFESYKFWV
jgi:hypothetical protein